MNKKLIYRVLVFACVVFGAFSCVKDLPESSMSVDSGNSNVSMGITFRPVAGAMLGGNTRSERGDLIGSVENIFIAWYDTDRKLSGSCYLPKSALTITDTNRPTQPDGTTPIVPPTGETHTQHVEFSCKIPYGRYRIYAVANMGDLTGDSRITNERDFKAIQFDWNADNIARNSQMSGYFKIEGENPADSVAVINSPKVSLHAWVRRAASKVTVAFDASRLNENISIYLKRACIKDIPASCRLFDANTPSSTDELIGTGDDIVYGSGDDYKQWVHLTRNSGENKYGSHADTDPSLFFFENMQGKHENKHQYKNYESKDDVPNGTYIEVEGYYESITDEGKSYGDIVYRCMLGKNMTDDFNAERNAHYKLTLVFNKDANDADWHIEYNERVQILDVTQPHDVNYQGKFFVPDNSIVNGGHTFSNENTVTVTSYIGDRGDVTDRNYENWTISFREKGKKEFTSECSWLTYKVGEVSDNSERKVTFFAKSDFVSIDIDAKLKAAKSKSLYNLAFPGGPVDSVKCTANCYMIDSPGNYMFPLVYGNSVHNGETNDHAYKYSGSKSGDNILKVFRNHLDKEISDPFIVNNGITPAKAELVWQDEAGLVSNIVYDATAYNNRGGIKFSVDSSTIKQGNAIIAIKDAAGTVIWSWHIWVTRFDFDADDKTITVTGHGDTGTFDLMPVNLGWCSEHGDAIRYYKGRECEIKFRAGDLEKTIKIVQKSHIAVPRGNNVYYQWGRKDPFIGTNEPWASKSGYDKNNGPYPTWDDKGSRGQPPRITYDYADSLDVDRVSTREGLYLLIRNPEKWHNPPRVSTGPLTWASHNETYENLWKGKDKKEPDIMFKTVYDPCPVGYQVCHRNSFCGFTVIGNNTNESDYWNDVSLTNMPSDYPAKLKDNLFEFYTDSDKLQSIIFPETGYRDWDSYAIVYQFNNIGYVWAAGTVEDNDTASFNFEFSRYDSGGYVRPLNSFYPCDGFPVRPCIYDRHGATISEEESEQDNE